MLALIILLPPKVQTFKKSELLINMKILKKIKGKNLYSIIAIALILATYLWCISNVHLYSKPKLVIWSDVRVYYTYLPATVIEKDHKMLFLSNLDVANNEMYPYYKTPNGEYIIKTSMGMAMMYSPFFFIAHALADKIGYEADGFSVPYAFALIFSCVFYLFVGFLFLRSVLLKYYKDKIVAITLIIIGVATNLLWYATTQAPMSHGYSFALFCIFLYLMEKWQEKQGWGTTVCMGLVAGLISLIRPTNGLIIIIFLLYNITNLKDIKTRVQLFLKNYWKIAVMTVCAFMVWLPQLLYWKSVTGEWFFYSYGGERFFFNDPKILLVLFSFKNGWLVYTPTMLFAIIGIGMLWKTNKRYFYPVLFFLIINLYIISSWWCWWYGGSFGMRPLVESYAILAIPLSAFLTWVAKQKLRMRIPLYIIVFAISAQSIFHCIQFHYGSIHWAWMTKEAYFDSFWRVKPSKKFNSLLYKSDLMEAKKGNRNLK
jgi:hypothetical protein